MNKPTRKLRVMWSSNSMWTTSGYASATRTVLPRIQQAGFPTAMVNFYGLEGGIKEEGNIMMYPKMGLPYGEDAVLNHSKDFNADIELTWQDVGVLNMDLIGQLNRWIPWCPVDREPMGSPILDRLRSAHRIISCSKFGQKEIQRNGLYSTYIPCSVETTVLKPSEVPKEEYRKSIGIPPDLFLFGMVSANKEIPPRKSFQEVLDAFQIFHRAHPKSGIFFHIAKLQGYAFPIGEYAKMLGIEKSIFYLDDYKQMFKVKESDMSGFYSMLDCLLLPSSAEGFGMPAVEAQSCGTPAIVNRFTSMTDLVIEGKTGFICEVAIKQYSGSGGYVGIPSVDSLYEQMEKVFKADRVQMGKDAREWVLSEYDADKVFNEKWLPYLNNIESHIYAATPSK